MSIIEKMPCTSIPMINEILTLHSKRNFGGTGIRKVNLGVYSGGVCAFSYTISHVWHATKEACRSLLYLNSPSTLEGTALLLIESPAKKDVEIWLRLRTAKAAVRVESSRAGQFVLGTDFTYEDLRFWLPTDEYNIEAACLQRNGDIESVARCLTPQFFSMVN